MGAPKAKILSFTTQQPGLYVNIQKSNGAVFSSIHQNDDTAHENKDSHPDAQLFPV